VRACEAGIPAESRNAHEFVGRCSRPAQAPGRHISGFELLHGLFLHPDLPFCLVQEPVARRKGADHVNFRNQLELFG
jgi:hypothetical protein